MKETKSQFQQIIVILKDVAKDGFLLREERCSEDSPWHVAIDVVEEFFDKHYRAFEKESPKDFVIYFRSASIPPMCMTAKLTVKPFTVYRSVIGYRDDPAEETFPYSLDIGVPTEVKPPDRFPPYSLFALAGALSKEIRKLDERKKQKRPKHDA